MYPRNESGPLDAATSAAWLEQHDAVAFAWLSSTSAAFARERLSALSRAKFSRAVVSVWENLASGLGTWPACAERLLVSPPD